MYPCWCASICEALVISGEGGNLLNDSYASRGQWDDASGLRFDKLLDTATGGAFGGETKETRVKAKQARSRGEIAVVTFQEHTNVCINLIVQDDLWRDWVVKTEGRRHQGIANRFIFPFAQGRMLGPLKFRNFFEHIYKILAREMIVWLLRTYSPQKDVLDTEDPRGHFILHGSEERLLKHFRMSCKQCEMTSGISRRKTLTALEKSGYYIPGTAWETCMLEQSITSVVSDSALKSEPLRRHISLACMVSASNFMAFRYTIGQVVLDNDISRQAWLPSKDKDPRDDNRQPIEIDIRFVLLRCPTNVLTLPLIAWFCSKHFDALKSKDISIFGPAFDRIHAVFQKMEEYNLGRLLDTGVNVRFQKRHSAALSIFARNFVRDDLRIPLWVFGFHTATSPAVTTTSHDASGGGDRPEQVQPRTARAVAFGAIVSHSPSSKPRDDMEPPPSALSDPVQAADIPRSGLAVPISAKDPRPPSILGIASKGGQASHIDSERQEPPAARGPNKPRCVWGKGTLIVPRTNMVNIQVCNREDAPESVRAVMQLQGHAVKTRNRPPHSDHFPVDATCCDAEDCPVQYRARIYFGSPVEIEIQQFGTHIDHEGHTVGSAAIFTAHEHTVANNYRETCSRGTMTRTGLKLALAAGRVSPNTDLTDRMMTNWIYRENAAATRLAAQVAPRTQPFLVVELTTNIEEYTVAALSDIMTTEESTKLCVLPGYTIDAKRGYVGFTCKDMLAALRAYRGRILLTGVDAKVGKDKNSWRIASFGFYAKGNLRRTTLTRHRSGKKLQFMGYTTQFRVVMQALMHSESTENYTDFFRDVIRVLMLAREQTNEQARASITELSKDWADGIEAARKIVMPDARPYGDFTHMSANLKSVIPKKCLETTVAEITWASSKSNQDWIQHAFKSICDHCPTVNLLDMLLQAWANTIEHILLEPETLTYLRKEKYVESLSSETLASWGIPCQSADLQMLLFSKAWRGLFSGWPGFKCGSQPVEAFHNAWERVRRGHACLHVCAYRYICL